MKKIILWLTAAAVSAGMLIPVTALAEDGDIVIEAETLAQDMISVSDISAAPQSLSTASGGAYEIIKTLPNTAFPDEKITASYTFDVETGGTYSLGITLQDISKDFSPCSVSIDSSEYASINAGIIESEGSSIGDYMVEYKTTLKYNLEAGRHTLNFRLDGARSDGRGFAHVDCFRLTPSEAEATDKIRIRGQQSHTKNFPIDGVGAEFYGTMFAKNTLEIQTSSKDPFPQEGLVVTYSFTVAEEGDYQLTVSAVQHGDSGLTYLSPYGIAVNDGEVTEINTENAGAASSPNGGFNTECPDVSDSAKLPIAIYNTSLYYHLYPGQNTVSFKVLSSRAMDTKAFAALAYIEFTKQAEPELKSQYTINGTDGHSIICDESASVMEDTSSLPGTLNIKTYADTQFPTGGITLNYSFRCEAAARYTLSLSASCHTRTTTLSTYAVSVNGSSYVTVDSASAGSAESPNGGWSEGITDVENMIGVYKTNLTYNLEQGMNTVSVKILTSRDADGRAYFYLEYIKFRLVDTFEHAAFDFDNRSLEIGETSSADVRAIGKLGAEMDISDAEVVYSSDNEAVVSVDKNGIITALCPGEAVIHADVTMGAATSSAEMTVYITVNGKYAKPVEWMQGGRSITSLPSGGEITVKSAVTNYGASAGRTVLIVVLYGTDGIKDCKIASVNLQSEKTEEISVNVDCGGAVRGEAYILENVASQLPIAEASVINAK